MYNLRAIHAISEREKMVVLLGATQLFKVKRYFGRTHVNIPVDAVRTLIRAGSITGVRVISDFPLFICDSCEYVKTTRKQTRNE